MLHLVVSDYFLEEEAREYVNSVNIEDDLVDKYSLPEQPQQEDVEAEVVEESPAEETLVAHHNVVNTVQEPPAMALEESVEEPPRRTYASIVSTSLLLSMQAFCLHMSRCVCGAHLLKVSHSLHILVGSAFILSKLAHICFILNVIKISCEF